MKSANAYLVAAFGVAFSVLLVIPMWAAYGVLFPKEDGHAHHGRAETPLVSEFEEKTARFIEQHRLPDDSVRAEHGKPIYVMAVAYTFRPNVIRLTAGEQYDLQMLSADMVHNFSIQMGDTSFNAVVMPRMVTAVKLRPTKPGTYLVICNEYCGIGHDYMYFSFIVEEGKDGQQDGRASIMKKGRGHGAH